MPAGFIEPLESTAIYLIQPGINRLMQLFPTAGCDPALQRVYNEQSTFEYERIRDFIILHYPRDSARRQRVLELRAHDEHPGHAQASHRIVCARTASSSATANELFGLTSWVQVMLGQGIYPRTYHPAVDWVAEPDMLALVGHVENVIASNVQLMPQHEDFMRRCCAAEATPERQPEHQK